MTSYRTALARREHLRPDGSPKWPLRDSDIPSLRTPLPAPFQGIDRAGGPGNGSPARLTRQPEGAAARADHSSGRAVPAHTFTKARAALSLAGWGDVAAALFVAATIVGMVLL